MSGLSSVSLLRGVWGQVGKLSSVCHGHEQRPPSGKGSSREQGRTVNCTNPAVSQREEPLFCFPLGASSFLMVCRGRLRPYP